MTCARSGGLHWTGALEVALRPRRGGRVAGTALWERDNSMHTNARTTVHMPVNHSIDANTFITCELHTVLSANNKQARTGRISTLANCRMVMTRARKIVQILFALEHTWRGPNMFVYIFLKLFLFFV